ncbi:MAG: T9SS type A sorting domain-containing protein [Clostridium sp.]|nr:T9SS type A sorting domain-containing protein [Clostridium sp.]
MALLLGAVVVNAKTLVAYYSYTNTVEHIVNTLSQQITCDVIEIEPAEKGLDYAANNYALGTRLLNAIKANPDEASSYPGIDPVDVNMDEYDTVIIACPLWWSQMAAPFQTFLFHYGPQMAGKNVAMIISSWSSGTGGVIADAKRLIPEGIFIEPVLWDRASHRVNASSIAAWLNKIHYNNLTSAVVSISADNDFEIVAENGMLSVNGESQTLSLYHLSGNKMVETTDKQLSTNALSPGIYIAQASNGNRSVTHKISVR